MTIQAGSRVPDGTLKTMTPEGPRDVTSASLFDGKRVVLFGVPGAFTPGCSRTHLPGFIQRAEEILAQGVDTIACVAVNDVWVMNAWGEAQGAAGKVTMLADGSGHYITLLGLALDLDHVGMGLRCKRFSMVVQDGVVESVNVDDRAIESTTAAATCGLD